MNHQLINLENLKDYCSNSMESNNSTIYRIDKPLSNSVILLALDEVNNKIFKYSNEYLYLINYNLRKAIKGDKNSSIYYNEIINIYKNMVNSSKNEINSSYCDKKVISFVTSFSRGTVHGYSGLFCILNQYINNFDKLKDYYIVVWKKSQRGIIEIIKEYASKGIIPSDKIIYIDSNITYRFKSMNFIHNKWHNYLSFAGQPNFKLDIIRNHLIDSKKYALDFCQERICIIKSSASTNLTQMGIVQQKTIEQFCKKYKLFQLEPANLHEVDFINKIHKAKILVVSWGTAWFKNQVYLSDNCTDVYVLVIGEIFHNQYKNFNNWITNKLRNTKIHYILLDNDELNMPDDFLINIEN